MARAKADNDSWIDPSDGLCRARRASSRAPRLLVLIVVGLVGGCSGRGTYITGGPSNSQLKSSLSHLEYENDKLKTQVARLKEENRSIEDRLVQEQLHNGEITAKLDNVRNLLRDRGYDGEDDLDAPLARPKTLPAGRTTPPRRKAPAAQISQASETEEIPPIRIEDSPQRSRSPSSTRSRSSTSDRDEDSLGLRDEGLHWTPIAQGDDPPAKPKR